MQKRAWALAAIAVLGLFSLALGQVRFLIVDQTQTIEESMRLEALARTLLASGNSQLAAVTEPPGGPHPKGPFQFVVIVPERGSWVWVCTPTLPNKLPPALQTALQGLEQLVEQVFQGERRARDPGEDLYPALWSAYFLKVGILEGVSGG